MDLDQPGAGWASGPQFDPDLLRLYYARLFPYDQWCKWMAYNSDEPGTGSQLARRELSLTLADDVYIRYQCFTNCLLYTSPSPRDQRGSRMPSSA